MANDMTIGLDFLKANTGIINMRESILPLEGKMLMSKFNLHEGLHSSLVWAQKRVCLPFNAVVQVQEQLDDMLVGDYIVSLEYGVLGSHALGMDHTTSRDFLNDLSTSVRGIEVNV
jgi:hypothetical protein